MLPFICYSIWPHYCCGPVCTSPRMWRHNCDWRDKQWQSTRRQNGSEIHHRGEFLHKYYMFHSVHDGDYGGAFRIFVGLSCELW